MKSVTKKSKACQSHVGDRNVCVIDTPGLFDTGHFDDPVKLIEEIGRSICLSHSGPHAFLIVLPVNMRFTDQEKQIIQIIEWIFGEEVRKYAIVLFTHGDQLKGENVENLIKENEALHELVQQCGGGYHVFNNKEEGNREQVRMLLQKIDRMVEKNRGTCYSNEMFEEAARLREEAEERLRRDEEERKQREVKQRQEAMDHVKKETEARIRRELGQERKTESTAGHESFLKRFGKYILAGVVVGLGVALGVGLGLYFGFDVCGLGAAALGALAGAAGAAAGGGVYYGLEPRKLKTT